MWQKSYAKTITNTSAEKIFQVIADVENWSAWDNEIASVRLTEGKGLNSVFYLKPKNGPETKLIVTRFAVNRIFGDTAFLPLAKMYTEHRMEQLGANVHFTMTITISGVLSFLWSRIIGKGQIAGAEKQLASLINRVSEVFGNE